jgi:thiamine biosynthesis lipoprotein
VISTSTTAPRVAVPLAIDAQPPALGAATHVLRGLTMGTSWCVKLIGAPRLDLEALQRELQLSLDQVVAQMSPWQADSHTSRFNAAPAGSWHPLPAEFLSVLGCALQVASLSGGAFDPTAGALVDLWGFGPPGPVDAPPSPASIAAACTATGWQRLAIDGTRALQPGGLRLDLSAIAKGFGVDQLSRLLSRRGLGDHLVEIGGELRGSGLRADAQPWWVDLMSPPSAANALPLTRIALHGLSVATSGDYLRHFDDAAGQRHSHTIDPRHGRPVEHGLCSVSVLHAECMQADALSTALTVLGPSDGMRFAREHGIAALFVERHGDALSELLSPAFDALLV